MADAGGSFLLLRYHKAQGLLLATHGAHELPASEL